MASYIIFEPPTEIVEVAQNLRMIVHTIPRSAPYARALGAGGIGLDEPINKAKIRITKEIIDMAAKYEPRAMISAITCDYNNETGRIDPHITFTVAGEGVYYSV